MKHQIRKVESVTVYLASKVITLDDKKFKKLDDNPFTGNTEEEFMEYLTTIDFDNSPEDLDDETRELLMSIEENSYTEYSSSAEHSRNLTLQIGEVNSEYRKSGGFKVNNSISI